MKTEIKSHQNKIITIESLHAQIEIFVHDIMPELVRCAAAVRKNRVPTTFWSQHEIRQHNRYQMLQAFDPLVARVRKTLPFKWLERLDDRLALKAFDAQLGIYDKIIMRDLMVQKVPRAIANHEFAMFARALSLHNIVRYIDYAATARYNTVKNRRSHAVIDQGLMVDVKAPAADQGLVVNINFVDLSGPSKLAEDFRAGGNDRKMGLPYPTNVSLSLKVKNIGLPNSPPMDLPGPH